MEVRIGQQDIIQVIANKIGVDDYGNVYVTGYSYGSSTVDYATIKYNSSGTQQWVARYSGPGGYDVAQSLAVTGAGYSFVTGYSRESSILAYDIVTIEYDNSGGQVWLNRYNSTTNNTESAGMDIAVDQQRGIYVVGDAAIQGEGGSVSEKIAVVGIYTDGTSAWANTQVTGSGAAIRIYKKQVGFNLALFDEIYVTGYDGNASEGITLKFDQSGILLHSITDGNRLLALAIDNYENVYVTGSSEAGIHSTITVAYDSSLSTRLWSASYNNSSGVPLNDIKLDGNGNTFVTGCTYSTTYHNDYLTIEYGPNSGNGPTVFHNPNKNETNNPLPKEYSLSQNYPNPFNPATTIKYDIPKATMVTIKVYDILGREVSTLVNEVKQPGYYQAEFNGTNLASGIYFYRIKTDKFTSVKKMVLVK